jgi:arginine repressor
MVRAIVGVVVALVLTHAVAASAGHVVSGAIESVDKASETIAIKTKDGAKHAFRVTKDTVVHGVDATDEDAKLAELDAKKGAHALVAYSEAEGTRVARSVKVVGKEGVETTEGTIDSIDDKAHTIAVKTKDGTVHVYHEARDGVLRAGEWTKETSADAAGKTGEALAKAKDSTVRALDKGSKVTVYYAREGKEAIAHAIERN